MSQSSTKQTTLLPTTVPVSTSTNKTEAPQGALPARGNIAAAVTVPILIILLVAVVIVVVIFIKKRRGKLGYGQESFSDSILSQDQEGSLNATNQIFDLDLRPTNSNGFTDSRNSDKIEIKRDGKAIYSKGAAGENGVDSNAFSNPLYEATKNLDSPDVDNSRNQLPLQEEYEILDNKIDYSRA